MNYCKRCLYPENHAFGLLIGDDGICTGCKTHEEKDIIDWSHRFKELEIIASEFRNKDGNNYDCIIPVNGGKDSFFVVDLVKNKLGLNPLCVHYNSHYSTKEGAANLVKLRTELSVDLIDKTVSPSAIKRITKKTLKEIGSIYWHVVAGESVFPVQVATHLKIPLIIWGAHQGINQTGMFSHHEFVEMSNRYRLDFDLMGLKPDDLIDDEYGISASDIAPFKYPSIQEIKKVGVRGIYLNNYIRWNTRQQHEEMSKKYSIHSRTQTRTFDKYSSAHCYLYGDLHDYIKLIKHGYSKIHDHVAREIRLGSLEPQKGLELINEYVRRRPVELVRFCNWLGVTETAIMFILDLHRNKKYWKRNDNWEWEYMPYEIQTIDQSYTYPVTTKWRDYDEVNLAHTRDVEDPFVLFGRGL